MGTPSYLINDKNDIRPEWLDGMRAASGSPRAPPRRSSSCREVVEELRARARRPGAEVHVVEEDVRFGLPRELT